MTKAVLTAFLLFLFVLSGNGQEIRPVTSVYSNAKLEKASQEDLVYLMNKAKKLKKTGINLSIAGPVTAGAGLAMFSASWAGSFGNSSTAGIGFIMFLGGIGVTAVGIPVLIIGSNRVNRINTIKSNEHFGMRIEIVPGNDFNCMTQKNQPNITLRFQF